MKFAAILLVALLLVNDASAQLGCTHFCDGKPLEDGTQIKTGSCSVTIQGDLPSSDKMTSTFITSPDNGATLTPDTSFDVGVIVNNLETGNFNDPEKEYYTDPQELNSNGIIRGHTHVSIQQIDGKSPPDAQVFAFFQGLNDQSPDGHFTVTVSSGLAVGQYRICTLSSSKAHQPVIMPVAKRGSQDDCIRINVQATKIIGPDPKGIQNDPKAKSIQNDPKAKSIQNDPKVKSIQSKRRRR